MPKGYIISRVDVTDPEAYAHHAAAATKASADHGRALARGGRCETLEGPARARNIVLEFEDYEPLAGASAPNTIRRPERCVRARR